MRLDCFNIPLAVLQRFLVQKSSHSISPGEQGVHTANEVALLLACMAQKYQVLGGRGLTADAGGHGRCAPAGLGATRRKRGHWPRTLQMAPAHR